MPAGTARGASGEDRPAARLAHVISAIDTHSGGEPTRIVVSGLPAIPGATMAERKRYMSEHLDHLRTALILEPRGHRDRFGAILALPTTARAQYGVVFRDAGDTSCGTGTSAAMAALYGRGEPKLGEEFVNEGILGTRLRRRLVREARVGGYVGVDAVITGQAYITGIQQFVIDPDDPLRDGFALGR